MDFALLKERLDDLAAWLQAIEGGL